ncbi:MAG: hypothetical protein RLZZ528_2275 [Pseudomonadota bacterium]
MRAGVILTAMTAFGLAAGAARADLTVTIGYLRQEVDSPPVLSNLDPVPEDLGIAGARLAMADSRTTGGFLGHDYRFEVVSVAPGGDLAAAAANLLSRSALVLVEGPKDAVLLVAGSGAESLFFNVSSGDAELRSEDCRGNLLHTALEQAAETDALMQVLAARQWARVALVVGPNDTDATLADAYRRSAAKFGVRIEGDKTWSFDTDLRESTMQEVPRFLQDLPEHDVLIVADATDDFGRYVEHNTWLPRPVAGSDGLVPAAWAPAVEAWGAVQLQNRFEATTGRDMRGQDYAAWAAVRAIAEAVTRTDSADPGVLRAYMLSEDFALDGFKGRPLSFRAWNGQMRQPVAVANDRALVAMAPVEGFLHRRNELDTLGLDEEESGCRAFKD